MTGVEEVDEQWRELRRLYGDALTLISKLLGVGSHEGSQWRPCTRSTLLVGDELAFALKSQWEDSLAVCATDNEMKILLGQVRKYYLTAITTLVVSRDCPVKPHQTRNFIVITIC